MNQTHLSQIASELKVAPKQVEATARLFAEGATVPFIARYRKEVTGSLDEVQIEAIRDRLKQLTELLARRETILKSLEELKVLTDTLRTQIEQADTLTRLEDLYAPYRPKRKTRASIARERGLEPLATWLLENQSADPTTEAARFVNTEKEVADTDAALAGARDIIAEQVSDHAECRAEIRSLFEKEGVLKSEVMPGKEEEAAKFRDYFDWSEPVRNVPSHRMLAIRRGSQEGFLFFSIRPPEEPAIRMLEKRFILAKGHAAEQVRQALNDSYRRLLAPTLETEIRLSCKKKADEAAIEVFADNIRELLMASPLGQKRTLAIDPGFRTGCKVVCLDAQGTLQHDTVIFPGQGRHRDEEAVQILKKLVELHQTECIAIGNGTGGREVETLVRSLPFCAKIPIVVVSESGASVYSASEVAREEFPDKDLTVRGAVSIGRRLMDPLAELVKIDPKSIGVGQYQHDVDPRKLKDRLDDVVVRCVNQVGVEVNTASEQLLSYVSGLNKRIASNIISHRKSKGPFQSRKDLLAVEGLGPKAYEQAAGFLRIRESRHPLDASSVHPESYSVVEKMAADLGVTVPDLMKDAKLRSQIVLENYITDKIGLPTLKDIISELEKPGRDPRAGFQAFSFDESVHKPEDLKVAMKLPGLVTNVAAFGAFVDIGVHQDGLVHISQLSDTFVKNPADVIKVGQAVEVTVVEIDLARKRIGLSMKSKPDFPGTAKTDRSGPAPRRHDNNRGPAKPRSNASLNDNWFDSALSKLNK